jgi:hypothetical protein
LPERNRSGACRCALPFRFAGTDREMTSHEGALIGVTER